MSGRTRKRIDTTVASVIMIILWYIMIHIYIYIYIYIYVRIYINIGGRLTHFQSHNSITDHNPSMRAGSQPAQGAQGAWIPKRSYNCRRSGSASRSCAWKVATLQQQLIMSLRVMLTTSESLVSKWTWTRSTFMTLMVHAFEICWKSPL